LLHERSVEEIAGKLTPAAQWAVEAQDQLEKDHFLDMGQSLD
jgi:hypothetical protein